MFCVFHCPNYSGWDLPKFSEYKKKASSLSSRLGQKPLHLGTESDWIPVQSLDLSAAWLRGKGFLKGIAHLPQGQNQMPTLLVPKQHVMNKNHLARPSGMKLWTGQNPFQKKSLKTFLIFLRLKNDLDHVFSLLVHELKASFHVFQWYDMCDHRAYVYLSFAHQLKRSSYAGIASS